MPKIPFTQEFPAVLDDIILEYLTFSDLNRRVEELPAQDLARISSEKILSRGYPTYVNLIEAKASDNYQLLLFNLKFHILPNLKLKFFVKNSLSDKEKYLILMRNAVRHLAGLVRNDFYPRRVQEKLDAQFVRDCIFHYAQFAPHEAGKILNRNIWKFWDRYVTECLIQYGADVNVLHDPQANSSLFQAIRWNGTAIIVRKLIKKGALYEGFKEERGGVQFTMMLVASLGGDEEVMEVFIETFPNEVQATLDSLSQMIEEYEDEKYSCVYNDGVEKDSNHVTKLFYKLNDIVDAHERLKKLTQKKFFDTDLQVTNSRSRFNFFKSEEELSIKDTKDMTLDLRKS